MADEDWYRNREWSSETAEKFWARLRRSRSSWNIAQYLRIQATILEDAGYPEDALELLEYLLHNYPEKSELSAAQQTRAKALLQLGRPNEAVDAFRSALDAEENYPNIQTDTVFDYATYAVLYARHDLYPEVEEALLVTVKNRSFLFPVQRFKVLAVGAIIENHRGHKSKAAALAQNALEISTLTRSGVPHHPHLGLVTEAHHELLEALTEIAGAN